MENSNIEYPISIPDYEGVYHYNGNDFVWDSTLSQWTLVPVSE